MFNKEKLLRVANRINNLLQGNVIFVGGFSEIMQGFKEYATDLDIQVRKIDFTKLSTIGNIYHRNLFFEGGEVCRMNIDGVFVDINASEERMNSMTYITIDNLKLADLKQLIKSKETDLKYVSDLDRIDKIRKDLERLKSI